MKGLPNYIYNLDGRQHSDILYVEIALEQFVTFGNEVVIEVAPDCEVIRGFVNVLDVFDGGTTDTIQVGDSVDDDRYLAATTLKTAGLKAMTPTGFQHGRDNSPQKLIIKRVSTGTAATKGTVKVFIETVAGGKAYHTQG